MPPFGEGEESGTTREPQRHRCRLSLSDNIPAKIKPRSSDSISFEKGRGMRGAVRERGSAAVKAEPFHR
jgi:hypothetical protein